MRLATFTILFLNITISCLVISANADKLKIQFSTSSDFDTSLVEYYEMNTNFYIALIDEENLPEFEKTVTLIGAFNFDGTEYGKSKVVIPAEYDNDGNVTKPELVSTVGTAIRPMDKIKYLELMRDVKTYDVDGTVLTIERPIEVKETHNFAGWGRCVFPEEVKIEAVK